MCDPEFKPGDKAEYNERGRWVPVTIWTSALRYVDDKPSLGGIHGVTFADDSKNIVYLTNLRRAEVWRDCPRKHRTAGPNVTYYEHMERLEE